LISMCSNIIQQDYNGGRSSLAMQARCMRSLAGAEN